MRKTFVRLAILTFVLAWLASLLPRLTKISAAVRGSSRPNSVELSRPPLRRTASISNDDDNRRRGPRELGGISALLPFPDTGFPVVDHSLLSNPDVDGLSVRVYWREFYVRQDDPRSPIRWAPLDEIFDAAERAGKSVRLAVAPGFYSPEWVLRSVPVLWLPVPQGPLAKDGQNLHPLPVPWDETYLRLWLHFVDEVAERYGNRSNFSWISVTGPNSHNGEVNLPHGDPCPGPNGDPCSQDTWLKAAADAGIQGQANQLDWLQERLEQAWFECIDRFDRAFGSRCRHYTIALIQQSFPVDINGGGREGTYKNDLVLHGVTDYPHAFGIQSNGLDGTPLCTMGGAHPWWNFVQTYSPTLLTGFQTQDPVNLYCPKYSRADVLHQTIDHAVEFQAHFLEIYSSDIMDSNLACDISYAHEQIMPFRPGFGTCMTREDRNR